MPAPTLVAAPTPRLLPCPTTLGGVSTLQELVEGATLLIESTDLPIQTLYLTFQIDYPLDPDQLREHHLRLASEIQAT